MGMGCGLQMAVPSYSVALVLLLASSGSTADSPVAPYVNLGTVAAVQQLLARQLPGAQSHFSLAINTTGCAGGVQAPCFEISDIDGGGTRVSGTGAAELASGVGYYLREHCNMVIGWKRGGGSNMFIPHTWPKVGATVSVRRNTPWSYMMNVCTHSYSLVWYSWSEWQEFLDWMALSGINLFLGMTGQEEIQYKVFRKYGLDDETIRRWFNGPALLTWSRGQNEYGADIGGPLPRSWMKHQWHLQKNITQRYRELGMSAQLPGFQGNVPVELHAIQNDTNITKAGATGWMNSADPLYAKIADDWMETLIADFGTDHWYQLDGYFDGGTAPWMDAKLRASNEHEFSPPASSTAATCTWGPESPNTFSKGCAESGCGSYKSADDAKAACVSDRSCLAVTCSSAVSCELRAGEALDKSTTKEFSYLISAECHPPWDLEGWTERGVAAYTGLNRTDPEAIWLFQGWAIVGWSSTQQRNSVKSFIDATPKGKFNLIDMSVNGDGEWKKWDNGTGLWANEEDHANYIWTTLHDFGGTDGLKGDLGRINHIPFDGLDAGTNVWGTGFTPEGIDQNPVYYEFMLDANWRSAPVLNITSHIISRSQRRYNLHKPLPLVAEAWALLVASAYSQDLSVQDGTGVPHLGGEEAWSFMADQRTPTATMYQIHVAWSKLLQAASSIQPTEPFRYDLVNTGREVLAQLAGPAGRNFSKAIHLGAGKLSAASIKETGVFYAQVLNDLDSLVATDSAFQLGPWIAMARKFATEIGVEDCEPSDAAGGSVLDQDRVDSLLGQHAYNWTTATNPYPTQPVGDFVEVSKAMKNKYEPFFASCY